LQSAVDDVENGFSDLADGELWEKTLTAIK
jgi:hypothetical protein